MAAKSILNEFYQRRRTAAPIYKTINAQCTDGFICTLTLPPVQSEGAALETERAFEGTGSSKKEAEHDAANAAVRFMQGEGLLMSSSQAAPASSGAHTGATVGSKRSKDSEDDDPDALEQRVLEALASVHPSSLTGAQLAKICGHFKLKSKVNHLLYVRLRNQGLVEMAEGTPPPAWRATRAALDAVHVAGAGRVLAAPGAAAAAAAGLLHRCLGGEAIYPEHPQASDGSRVLGHAGDDDGDGDGVTAPPRAGALPASGGGALSGGGERQAPPAGWPPAMAASLPGVHTASSGASLGGAAAGSTPWEAGHAHAAARLPSKRATSASSGDTAGGAGGGSRDTASSGRRAASGAQQRLAAAAKAAQQQQHHHHAAAAAVVAAAAAHRTPCEDALPAHNRHSRGGLPSITRPASKYARTGHSPSQVPNPSGAGDWGWQAHAAAVAAASQQQEQQLLLLQQLGQQAAAAAALQEALTAAMLLPPHQQGLDSDLLLQHSQLQLLSAASAAANAPQAWPPAGLMPAGPLAPPRPAMPGAGAASLYASLLSGGSADALLPMPAAAGGGAGAVAAAAAAAQPVGSQRFGDLLASDLFGVQLHQAASGAFRRDAAGVEAGLGRWGAGGGPSPSASHATGASQSHARRSLLEACRAAGGGGGGGGGVTLPHAEDEECMSPAVLAALAEAAELEPAPVAAWRGGGGASASHAAWTPPPPASPAISALGGGGGGEALGMATQPAASLAVGAAGQLDAAAAPLRPRGCSEAGVKRKLPPEPHPSPLGVGADAGARSHAHAGNAAQQQQQQQQQRRKSGRLSGSDGDSEEEASCDARRSAGAGVPCAVASHASPRAASSAASGDNGGGGVGNSCAASGTSDVHHLPPPKLRDLLASAADHAGAGRTGSSSSAPLAPPAAAATRRAFYGGGGADGGAADGGVATAAALTERTSEDQALQLLAKLALPETPSGTSVAGAVPPALRQEYDRHVSTVRDLVAKLADALHGLNSIRQAAAGEADPGGDAGPA